MSIPQFLWVALAGSGAFVAETQFSPTITLGSIIVGVVVIVVSGLFTIRSNVAKIWRETAEGERERGDQLEQKLKQQEEIHLEEKKALNDQIIREREEQQTIRHDMRNELATITLQLDAEKAKPDLSMILAQSKEQYAQAMIELTKLIAGVTENQREILKTLVIIQERLNGENP
jgi:hypothetical protein